MGESKRDALLFLKMQCSFKHQNIFWAWCMSCVIEKGYEFPEDHPKWRTVKVSDLWKLPSTVKHSLPLNNRTSFEWVIQSAMSCVIEQGYEFPEDHPKWRTVKVSDLWKLPSTVKCILPLNNRSSFWVGDSKRDVLLLFFPMQCSFKQQNIFWVSGRFKARCLVLLRKDMSFPEGLAQNEQLWRFQICEKAALYTQMQCTFKQHFEWVIQSEMSYVIEIGYEFPEDHTKWATLTVSYLWKPTEFASLENCPLLSNTVYL